MDRFVARRRTGSRSASRISPAKESPATTKMAANATKAKGSADSPSALERRDCQDHAKIAEEVVKLLTSSMNELIEWAVQQGMSHLHQELTKQAQCVTEVESRTSALENEQAYILANTDKMGKHIHALLNKVEDLESDEISITFLSHSQSLKKRTPLSLL